MAVKSASKKVGPTNGKVVLPARKTKEEFITLCLERVEGLNESWQEAAEQVFTLHRREIDIDKTQDFWIRGLRTEAFDRHRRNVRVEVEEMNLQHDKEDRTIQFAHKLMAEKKLCKGHGPNPSPEEVRRCVRGLPVSVLSLSPDEIAEEVNKAAEKVRELGKKSEADKVRAEEKRELRIRKETLTRVMEVMTGIRWEGRDGTVKPVRDFTREDWLYVHGKTGAQKRGVDNKYEFERKVIGEMERCGKDKVADLDLTGLETCEEATRTYVHSVGLMNVPIS